MTRLSHKEFPRWDHGFVYIGAIAALILVALYLLVG